MFSLLSSITIKPRTTVPAQYLEEASGLLTSRLIRVKAVKRNHHSRLSAHLFFKRRSPTRERSGIALRNLSAIISIGLKRIELRTSLYAPGIRRFFTPNTNKKPMKIIKER